MRLQHHVTALSRHQAPPSLHNRAIFDRTMITDRSPISGMVNLPPVFHNKHCHGGEQQFPQQSRQMQDRDSKITISSQPTTFTTGLDPLHFHTWEGSGEPGHALDTFDGGLPALAKQTPRSSHGLYSNGEESTFWLSCNLSSLEDAWASSSSTGDPSSVASSSFDNLSPIEMSPSATIFKIDNSPNGLTSGEWPPWPQSTQLEEDHTAHLGSVCVLPQTQLSFPESPGDHFFPQHPNLYHAVPSTSFRTQARSSSQGEYDENANYHMNLHSTLQADPVHSYGDLSPLSTHYSPQGPLLTSQDDQGSSSDQDSDHSRLSDKNAFLVRAKMGGMSYKAIREAGGFREAESTLRGRFRSLTKDKHDRVRKPMWTKVDVKLLFEAVRRLTEREVSGETGCGRVPWKKVAE